MQINFRQFRHSLFSQPVERLNHTHKIASCKMSFMQIDTARDRLSLEVQASQGKDNRTPSRYKPYCVTKNRFIRVCVGTLRLSLRIYEIEHFANKNDLSCCCVVFFVVCQLLRQI